MAYRRRSYRRRRTPLRRVYTATGAKSQARQIAYLNKKVNRIARANRPEVKQWLPANETFSFANSTIGPGVSPFAAVYLKGPDQNLTDGGRQGSYINVKNVSAHFYFEYYNNSTTGYHTSESAGAVIRILAIQRKESDTLYSSSITPGMFIFNYSSSGAGYTGACNAPLVPNITADYRILYDKTRTISISKNQLTWEFNLRNVRNHIYKSDTYVNNVMFLILVTGLHADTDFSDYVTGAGSFKMAYTDA